MPPKTADAATTRITLAHIHRLPIKLYRTRTRTIQRFSLYTYSGFHSGYCIFPARTCVDLLFQRMDKMFSNWMRCQWCVCGVGYMWRDKTRRNDKKRLDGEQFYYYFDSIYLWKFFQSHMFSVWLHSAHDRFDWKYLSVLFASACIREKQLFKKMNIFWMVFTFTNETKQTKEKCIEPFNSDRKQNET